jgi:hypothetical protein
LKPREENHLTSWLLRSEHFAVVWKTVTAMLPVSTTAFIIIEMHPRVNRIPV